MQLKRTQRIIDAVKVAKVLEKMQDGTLRIDHTGDKWRVYFRNGEKGTIKESERLDEAIDEILRC